MAKYKVLWFDDEWEELEEISENALDKNIELVGVSNAEDGLRLLRENSRIFQAVILDGKFYLDPSKTGDEINDDAFGEVALFLHDLHTKGQVLPWFILSGQPQFVIDIHRSVKNLGKSSYGKGKVFDKNKDEDIKLFEVIIEEIDKTPLLQAYVNHKAVFESCSIHCLGPDQEERVFNIIKSLVSNELQNSEDLFTPLRKLLERMIERMAELGIVPENLSLNELKRFSISSHNTYEVIQDIFPPLISYFFNFVIDLIQDACHLTDGLSLKVEEHIRGNGQPYLYQSTAFGILELMAWFNNYCIQNPERALNLQKWRLKSNGNIGPLERDSQGNYHVGQTLLPYGRVHGVLEIGINLLIEKSIDNDKETKSMYPKFATRFQVIVDN